MQMDVAEMKVHFFMMVKQRADRKKGKGHGKACGMPQTRQNGLHTGGVRP